MKIFRAQETSKVSDTRGSGEGVAVKKSGRGKKKLPAEKPQIAESEIKEKLAAHVETSNTAKSGVMKKNAQKLGEGFMNSEMKPAPVVPAPIPANSEEKETETEEKHLLKSDINLNDPKDPATQEKLKTVLSTGAFNFNPRERDILDKILADN